MERDPASAYTFSVEGGALWLTSADKSGSASRISVTGRRLAGATITHCHQSTDAGGSVQLSFVLHAEGQHQIFHHMVHRPGQLHQSPSLPLHTARHVLTTSSSIDKITHTGDGLFASTASGEAFYVQTSGARRQPVMLVAAPVATPTAALGSSGPFEDIFAAKNGIATFLDNMADQLPNIAGAVEKKVTKTILDDFGQTIKSVQTTLDSLFEKPLTYFISQNHSGTSATALMAGMAGKGSGTGGSASSGSDTVAPPSRQDLHALLVRKMDIGRYFNVFGPAAMAAAVAPAPPSSGTTAGSDPWNELGQLFQPFSTFLNAKSLVKLIQMASDDLIRVLAGNQPFSSVVDDFFSLFKVDDMMAQFNMILSGGQVSKLVADLGIKGYLDTPITNDFFSALYDHFFPDQTFTARDLIALSMAIVAFSVAEIQGKESGFRDTFNTPANVAVLTGFPASLVTLIGGRAASEPSHVAMRAMAAAPGSIRDTILVVVGCIVAVLLTLVIGFFGVLSYGTGLIASAVVGGIAGGIGQTLGGLFIEQDLKDSGANMLAGFVGGFTGAYVATLLGNKAFGSWAQNGATPTARVNKLKLIMAGSVITLGGGGGGVVASVIKTKVATGTIKYDDPISLAAGITAGLGGGAMGCGLHFMGGLSGSSCLPIVLTRQEAAASRIRAILPAAGPLPPMSNATAVPMPNPAFPAGLLANPNYSLGVYATLFNDPAAVPNRGLSFALVKREEFEEMNRSYNNVREKLFWLRAGAGGGAPLAADQVDMIIGVHGIGRYVFPCLVYQTVGGANVNYCRPFYKDDFAAFVAADADVMDFLRTIAGRRPRIKLAVCFSALPIGCCSLGQELATVLEADVYASRPPIIPYLDNARNPRVPGMGGWIKYTP